MHRLGSRFAHGPEDGCVADWDAWAGAVAVPPARGDDESVGTLVGESVWERLADARAFRQRACEVLLEQRGAGGASSASGGVCF